ncbi:hypothetical protein [Alicyclobacillus sp. SO9]|nr:hypothetical protein [Alicyclobacillus sp. SO9]
MTNNSMNTVNTPKRIKKTLSDLNNMVGISIMFAGDIIPIIDLD